ncbi:MAG: hypothetical protein ABI220_00785 [Candidatus Saccharimonadales bacterium]
MLYSDSLKKGINLAIVGVMAAFGFTGLASANSISNTGPGSTNIIRSSSLEDCTIVNSNYVNVSNSNYQTATTGDASSYNNTNALPWTGWSTLDPASWQADGNDYNSWWTGVSNWVTERASGDGWNSSETNISWAPSGADWQASWSNWNPVTWQANGQSFSNWYTQLNSYLTSNSAKWMLAWPTSATGNGLSGATSGNATNTNNVSFSLNISNSLPSTSQGPSDPCDPASPSIPITPVTPVTPVNPGGGSGSGHLLGDSTSRGGGGAGGSGSGYTGGYYTASGHYVPKAPAGTSQTPPSQPGAPVVPSQPGNGGSPVTPPSQPQASISNTGPGSTNVIASSSVNRTSVSNTNNVSFVNTNTQTATSGNATSAGNTGVGGTGSGGASNGNGAGANMKIDN